MYLPVCMADYSEHDEQVNERYWQNISMCIMMKRMKNLSKFLSELVFTVLVAGIGSVLLAFVALFVAGNLDVATAETKSYINFVSGILFGLVVGYKLNELVREHTGGKKKKR